MVRYVGPEDHDEQSRYSHRHAARGDANLDRHGDLGGGVDNDAGVAAYRFRRSARATREQDGANQVTPADHL